MEKLRLEREQQLKLSNELNKVKLENEKFIEKQKRKEKEALLRVEDPWKQAEESKNENPIESTTIKPRS
ncbi:Uncharacterised protein [Chlamydia trachomatis]|nr:Uncharacterised protein [Chlamydia trachomatis]